MKNIKRYSIPARLIELLWTDDDFFREVLSLKKASSANHKFPKNDQYVDHQGFHLEFALAGYSPKDIELNANGNILSISGAGLEGHSKALKTEVTAEALADADPFDEYTVKEAKPALYHGNIIRGIARRSFNVKFTITDGFDLTKARATMKHGLLHVIIPGCERSAAKNIEINTEE